MACWLSASKFGTETDAYNQPYRRLEFTVSSSVDWQFCIAIRPGAQPSQSGRGCKPGVSRQANSAPVCSRQPGEILTGLEPMKNARTPVPRGGDKSDEERDYDDDREEDFYDCGFVPHAGICTKAGSEECDWECPYRETFEGD